MSLINRLIAEAKKGAETVWINPNQVGTVVEHYRRIAWGPPVSRDDVERGLLAGTMFMLNARILVRGAKR